MPADYSEQLTYLLRYPLPTFTVLGSSSEMPSSSHHITLLLRQALSLQMAPTFATGAAVAYENRNLLNIPVEVPDPPLPPTRKQVIGERGKSSSSVESAFHRGGHNRHASNSMGLPEMFARGLLDRGESLGINKTVMNAVSELKVSETTMCISSSLMFFCSSVIYQILRLRFFLPVSHRHSS
jgi:TBC1 domain family protein 5